MSIVLKAVAVQTAETLSGKAACEGRKRGRVCRGVVGTLVQKPKALNSLADRIEKRYVCSRKSETPVLKSHQKILHKKQWKNASAKSKSTEGACPQIDGWVIIGIIGRHVRAEAHS